MRTTLTIDDDLAENLKEASIERGQSFEAVVNAALRRGLSTPQTSPDDPYTSPRFHLGSRPGVDLTKALALAAALDDEETVRKLELGK